MTSLYIKIPQAISFNSIVEKDYTLSSSQYMDLIMPNSNVWFVKDFLTRPLERKDLGVEVGSLNYISKSTHYFIRTKALQSHSFLPEINKETTLPIMPSVFVEMNLQKGDVLISKDSNIGEAVILDKDYPDCMLSGAIYKLPVQESLKYYLLAFIKHPIFREQLDFMVPKGATIRHAKTMFLDCKIPLPNQKKDETIEFITILMKAIIEKERLIRERHELILESIETELKENQKPNTFTFELPRIQELESLGRLDTGLYSKNFRNWNFLVENYQHGNKNLIGRGFTWARGTSLEEKNLGVRINSDTYVPNFYQLIIPTDISEHGYVIKSTFIGTPQKLKTIKQGDIIFGGEGFGKGRTFVVIDDQQLYATNYHGIRIININKNLTESIFIRCFLSFWREKGLIDSIGVGGSGGHCSPSYFKFIQTPLFPPDKQAEIACLYHNAETVYTPELLTLSSFLEEDEKYNQKAGIYELDKTAKHLKALLNKAIDDVVNDRPVDISFG